MIDRRQFLVGSSAAALLAAAHGSAVFPATRRRAAKATPFNGPENPRILALDLVTAAPLEELERYYAGLLGLRVVRGEPGALEVHGGHTVITFRQTSAEGVTPAYHFAFNIPENKLFEARKWQLDRTPLLKRPPDAYSHSELEDVTDFWHWNAHSVFFEDPAGNLLEYIARHDLNNGAPGPFTAKDILYASEIGFVAQDVPEFGEGLQVGTGLDLYYAGGDRFRAYGDPNGLLLVLQAGIPRWSNQRPWSVYPTAAQIRSETKGRYKALEHPYAVELEGAEPASSSAKPLRGGSREGT